MSEEVKQDLLDREQKYNRIEKYLTIGVVCIIIFGGIAIGFIDGPDTTLPSPYNYISSIVGWIYFMAWSLSFYPQVYLNWKTKSVAGMSFDFQIYNFLGFFFYSCYNFSLLFVSSVQQEYIDAYHEDIPVRMNDFFFSAHAFLLTCITIIQIIIYDRKGQTVSHICIIVSSCLVAFAIGYIPSSLYLIYTLVCPESSSLLTYFTALSSCKLIISAIKYFPQAYLNFRRKSTYIEEFSLYAGSKGFNIGNILLDFTGGMLSEIQLFMIAILTGAWKSLFGNFVKLGLGYLSIIFDIVFMVQHYCLYKDKERKSVVVESLVKEDFSIEDISSPSIKIAIQPV